jgi:hemerythrin-like domain-containing protein
MKRSPQLSPLSRDHHRALEVALRLRRAGEDDVADVVAAFATFWRDHGLPHFEQEEEILLPALGDDEPEVRSAAQRVRDEHASLRELAERLGPEPDDVGTARQLGTLLHDHVRFEERILFPLAEERLPPDELDEIADALDRARG